MSAALQWAADILGFLLVVAVIWRWVVPALNRMTAARQERIRQQLEEGRRAQAEADAERERYLERIEGIRAEAARLREEARADGEQIVAEARERAREEAERIARSVRESLSAQRQLMVAQMRAEAGRLATELAARIVAESMNDERQHRIIDRFLTDLEQAPTREEVR